ncbi:MAG: phosphotransacetylase family protein [Coriobacteriia bacterium]|nr:phosphotransacetylase family protein [Coriobacteriia bacterium]
MRTVIVASTRPYSGKSGVCLALIRELSDRGEAVGYFKPFGTMPVTVDGTLTDADAAYINSTLRQPAPRADVCPMVRTRSMIDDVTEGRAGNVPERVREAFDRCAADRDVMVVEGPSDVFEGRAVQLSACQLSDLLEARVLLIDKPERADLPDGVLGALDCLGERLGGVLYNWVRESDIGFFRDHVAPFLGSCGVRVFGVLPQDPLLSSVRVTEIAEDLGATVLSAEDRLEEHVETFMVGAMGQDKALRFFRRRGRKAVITGGDRADVQLAALETSTRCLILTGNLPPSPLVLARAEDLGVPMLLVDMDTLAAVERMERLMGRARLRDPEKAGRIRRMLLEGTPFEEMLSELTRP